MTTSQWPAVVDAVLVACRASTALSNAKVTVFDGPPVSDGVPLNVICIGHVLDDVDDLSGTIEQTYHDTGLAAARDEVVTIRCCARSVNGDGNLSAARTAAFASLAALEATLRADFDLTVAAAERIEVTAGDVRQVQSPNGCGVDVLFTITATCLI